MTSSIKPIYQVMPAIKLANGKVYTGRSHSNILCDMREEGIPASDEKEQGFMIFVNRQQAMGYAWGRKLIPEGTKLLSSKELYSEDLINAGLI